jgi:hypothetical protein
MINDQLKIPDGEATGYWLLAAGESKVPRIVCDVLFGSFEEPLHNSLYWPDDRTIRKMQFNVDLALRVLVIHNPLAADS